MKRALAASVGLSLAGCAAIAGVRELSIEPVDAAIPADAESDARATDDGACASDTDPLNCGECRYACPGSACTGGTCAPALIATSVAGGRGLALSDDGVLFWATPQGLKAHGTFSLSGAAIDTAPDAAVTAVAAHHARDGEAPAPFATLYWNDAPDAASSTLLSCTESYGTCAFSPDSVAVVPNLGALSSPSAQTVCWTERGDGGAVRCMDGTSGTPRSVAVAVADPWPLAAINGVGTFFGTRDGVGFCASAGCSGAVTLQAAAAPVVAMAIGGDDYLYYATKAGEILRAKLAATGGLADAQSLAIGQGTVTAIAVSDVRVYWTTLGSGADDGALVGFSLADESTRVLARAQRGPRGVVADSVRVYWLTTADGDAESSVWALPR